MSDHHPQASGTSPIQFIVFTVIASAIAAAAAFGSAFLQLAPWAMFVGWVTCFTQPTSARQGLFSGISLWLGLATGAIASVALGALVPTMGLNAVFVVVFAVACVVVSMRAVPVVNNILAWFLGLIAFFASHLEPSLVSIGELGSAGTLGIGAGWGAQALQTRFARITR